MNFIAFDFETANSRRASACALGVAVVENNKIVETKSWLIKPEPLEFNMWNVRVHGITENDVIKMPTFDEYWHTTFKQYFENKYLVAHNSSFDMSVLCRTLEYYNINYSEFDCFCSYQLARKHLPHLHSHKLNDIANHYNILLNHHEAHSDAIACAKIVLQINDELCSYANEESYNKKNFNIVENKNKNVKLLKNNFKKIIPCNTSIFKNKNVVITGDLDLFTRTEFKEIISMLGGVVTNSVTRNTNFLVEGQQDPYKLKGHKISNKSARALELIQLGQSIQIISEDSFCNLIKYSG